MKSKEEITNHLKHVGYDDKTIIKICGWLIGRGIKAIDERVQIRRGNNNFDFFFNWYNNEFISFSDVKIGDYIKVYDDEIMVVVHKSANDFVLCMRKMFIRAIPADVFDSYHVRHCSKEEVELEKKWNAKIELNHIIAKLTTGKNAT